MGVQMKQTARIHHRKATSFFFLSGPGIVSLASSLILVNKPTGLNRKKKHPQGHNDFSTWHYTLFQLGKEFLHINNLIPCLKSTEPWCTNITRMWDTSMWSVNTGVQLHRKSVILKLVKWEWTFFQYDPSFVSHDRCSVSNSCWRRRNYFDHITEIMT